VGNLIKDIIQKKCEIVDKFFLSAQERVEVLMKMASRADKWKRERPLARIENCLSS